MHLHILYVHLNDLSGQGVDENMKAKRGGRMREEMDSVCIYSSDLSFPLFAPRLDQSLGKITLFQTSSGN